LKKAKVVIGLSGGVDSSVAAWLMKKQGYEVIAVFMRNWHDTTGLLEGDCPANDDVVFARLVARKLDIPFHIVDLSNQYRQRVVDYMFTEYQAGRTPNPDVLCNREIKFDEFIQATRQFDPDYFATGHYCKKEETLVDGRIFYRLLAGKDRNKDQSYFLCQLSQNQLSNALFPIGNFTKPEVREIASELQLPTAERKDSQGICFVGKVDLPTFLQQKLAVRKGPVIEIQPDCWFFEKRRAWTLSDPPTDEELEKMSRPYYYSMNDGKKVGEHCGAHFFTIGQRKGLNIGGKKEPLFVIGTDTIENIVYTGEGHGHPGLNRRGLFIRNDQVHWVRPDLAAEIGKSQHFLVRIRYRQPLQKAVVYCRGNGLYILFEESQRGITPGQFAAWYLDDELVGSGVIEG
jgi:tRNA-uridine 2-sulfurtransferase